LCVEARGRVHSSLFKGGRGAKHKFVSPTQHQRNGLQMLLGGRLAHDDDDDDDDDDYPST
jgi:hypothetical protein